MSGKPAIQVNSDVSGKTGKFEAAMPAAVDEKKRAEADEGLQANRSKFAEARQKKREEDEAYQRAKDERKAAEEARKAAEIELIRQNAELAKRGGVSKPLPTDPDEATRDRLAAKAQAEGTRLLDESRAASERVEQFKATAANNFETTKEFVPNRAAIVTPGLAEQKSAHETAISKATPGSA